LANRRARSFSSSLERGTSSDRWLISFGIARFGL
jgi:hypothetical protein